MRTWRSNGHDFALTWLAKFYRENILQITQSEFAERVNQKQSNVSAHENGKFQPAIHNCYIDHGLVRFFDSMSGRQSDVLYQLYTGSWKKRLGL